MLSIIYVSVADPELDRDSIEALVETAQANNARDGLTGTLIYNGQNFMQVLEGPIAKAEACLARIRADRRHCAMIELRRRIIADRAFADFSMHYSPLFRKSDVDVRRLPAVSELDPEDERLMVNFLALGHRRDCA